MEVKKSIRGKRTRTFNLPVPNRLRCQLRHTPLFGEADRIRTYVEHVQQIYNLTPLTTQPQPQNLKFKKEILKKKSLNKKSDFS
jgi:hypothetical protein